MQLSKSLLELHDDKLLDVIERHITAGRDNEIRQALPQLIEQRSHLATKLTEVQQRLNQSRPAPEMIASSAGVALSCNNCGGSLSKQAAETEIVICQYCGQNAELPAGAATIQWPRTLDFQTNFTLGSFFDFKGERWQAIGVQHYSGKLREWDSEDSEWETNRAGYTLWWMLNKKRQLAWISDYGKTRYWSYKYIPKQPGIPKEKDKRVEYGDWKLQFAAGEFSYKPSPDEKKKTWEHTGTLTEGKNTKAAKSKNLSVGIEARIDHSGKPLEIEFFRHLKLSNRDVITGIGASDSLKEVSRWKQTGMVLIAAAICSFLVGTAMSKINKGSTILEKQHQYTLGETVEIGEIYIEDAPAVSYTHLTLPTTPYV